MTVMEYKKSNPPINYTPTTRRCLVCGKVENESASTINEAAAWLCPECKKILRQMIRLEEVKE